MDKYIVRGIIVGYLCIVLAMSIAIAHVFFEHRSVGLIYSFLPVVGWIIFELGEWWEKCSK